MSQWLNDPMSQSAIFTSSVLASPSLRRRCGISPPASIMLKVVGESGGKA